MWKQCGLLRSDQLHFSHTAVRMDYMDIWISASTALLKEWGARVCVQPVVGVGGGMFLWLRILYPSLIFDRSGKNNLLRASAFHVNKELFYRHQQFFYLGTEEDFV
jgi:hypothetical protein